MLLFQLDGKIPNLALMRIAAHHRALGNEVELRIAGNQEAIEQHLWDRPDRIYASAIFRRTIPLVEHLLRVWPDAIYGGTAVDPYRKGEPLPLPASQVIKDSVTEIEQHGIVTNECCYEPWPPFRQSLGFTQRGCRLKCKFCCVPTKEGKVRAVGTVNEIWRGDPWPREVLLLDNDFFGQPDWRARIAEIRDGGFKVSFNQGINARCLTEEAAEAIASVDYRDDSMKVKRIYTAWDNKGDEERLFAGLNRLVKYGVKPDHIMVYILIGYWPGETAADREYRRAKLREFGARPYPMPFVRTQELVGFQRWVIGAYDKRIPWRDWESANYRPEQLGSS